MIAYLFAATVQFCGCQNVRYGSESMENHSRELNDEDEGEEKHEDQTDWLQLQVVFRD